ncbi:MAG: ABC transporter ATP-binding protein [Actinobacteria bacterium]|nr:ABC transporter ATP-binding protein [Actinomycetota bacterium]
MTALFETQDLTVQFRVRRGRHATLRRLTALDHVTVRWDEGETLALVGESGSGKTTLGRVLLGLQPPTSGSVTYAGRPIRATPRLAFRRRVQAVFQDPYQSLNPRATVGAHLLAGLAIHSLGQRGVERVAMGLAALEAAGLTPPERFWNRYPHELSGGQRQRVVIAGAIALGPQALICDEPVSALDVSVRAQVLQLLDQLRTAQGLSLLFITHDVGLARQMSDRIAVLYEGQLVEYGPTATVLDDPQHEYTRRLLAAVPTIKRR